MTDLDPVATLLREASDLDEWAQQVRREAGVLLKRAGCAVPSVAREAAEALQVDTRLIELLLAMSLRARPKA